MPFQKGHLPFKNAYVFPKGHIPWNKGTKGVIKPNSGCFKKGDKTNLGKKNALGFRHSEKTKMVLSIGKLKEKNPNWIQDRSKIDYTKRTTAESKRWIRLIKKRDVFCKMNNKDCKGILEAHHILSWHDYPELRYEIKNGILLCHYHHPYKKEEASKLIPFFNQLIVNT